ncbi:MAG: hypothetical protein FK734_10610 [Asgard group archaeon]|nr:hypothetical protein [Asgard group archaeon]
MTKEKYLQIVSIIAATLAFSVIIIFSLAIYYYPGGTYSDPDYVGFNFQETTISDLGRIIARNGEDNTISRALFMTGILSMSAFCGILPIFLVIIFTNRKSTKILSIIGAIFGIAQAGMYVALAFTPVDIDYKLHNKFIFSASAFLVATTIVYLIVFFMVKQYPKLGTYSCLVLFVGEFVFMVAVIVGSILQGPIREHIRRAGNTTFIFLSVLIYGLQFIALTKYYHLLRKVTFL